MLGKLKYGLWAIAFSLAPLHVTHADILFERVWGYFKLADQ